MLSGSHVLSATTAASGACGSAKAEYNATAPPWEKPPMITRLRCIPAFSSPLIKDWTETETLPTVRFYYVHNVHNIGTNEYIARPRAIPLISKIFSFHFIACIKSMIYNAYSDRSIFYLSDSKFCVRALFENIITCVLM